MMLRPYLLQAALFIAAMACLALGMGLGVRAGEPANPLRSAVATAGQSDGDPQIPPPPAPQLPSPPASMLPRPPAAMLPTPALPTPASPPSVVPERFGQPALLPEGNSYSPTEFPGGHVPGGSNSEEYDGTFLEASPFEHLVHPLFVEPWFSHSDPNDPHRHIGIGQPLVGTSWRNRPLFIGSFVGGIMMDDLMPNQIYQNDTTFVGARLGFDFDHYWGVEGRWAFARPELVDSLGAPLNPASRDNFGDVSLVYYPLGDSRWRPYLSAGMGFVTFRFNDEFGQRISEAAFEVPLAFGVKYYFSPWFTLRFDFADNLALGNDRVSGMHNVSLMAGAEFRFGGRRPSYFPWHNNTAYW